MSAPSCAAPDVVSAAEHLYADICALSPVQQEVVCPCWQVRAFTKKTGHKPDFADPVVLSADRGGVTVEHLCARLHATLAKQFHYALVWGTSAKHYPQR